MNISRYSFLILTERVIAEFRLGFYRLFYGLDSISGPMLRFGSGLTISIRNHGKFHFGKISARGRLSVFCDGGTIQIEDRVFFNRDCSINSMSSVHIRSGTMFGEGVKIYDHNHDIDEHGAPSIKSFSTKPVLIGKNCWIGSGVIILAGVSLCDGVVIGAGCIVTKSIDSPGSYVCKSMSHLTQLSDKSAK